MTDKKIVFIDMDGVLADFDRGTKEWLEKTDSFYYHRYKNKPDHIPGIFRTLPLIEGAKEAITKLHRSNKFNLYIATAASWGNPSANTDKRLWIEDHFGSIFKKKMVITHLKDHLYGDYLIDDRIHNGAGKFGVLTQRGEHVHFGTEEFPDWKSVLSYLM
jgi:5'-nucleotidase